MNEHEICSRYATTALKKAKLLSEISDWLEGTKYVREYSRRFPDRIAETRRLVGEARGLLIQSIAAFSGGEGVNLSGERQSFRYGKRSRELF